MGVLGIDLSLRAPGFAVLDSEDEALLVTSQNLEDFSGPERWELIIKNIKEIIDNHVIEFVVIEGYGFNSFKLGDLAEVGGILRYFLYKRKIPFGTVPPATLKKFFTGDGRADKKKMMTEAFKRGFKCDNDNESDAVALAAFGLSKGFESLKRSWKPPCLKQSSLNL